MTDDVLLKVKARGAGFEVRVPSWKKLDDEPDAAELENRRLRQKIVELERRAAPEPELRIQFLSGESSATVELRGLELSTGDDVDYELSAERGLLETRFKYLLNSFQRAPSAKTIDRYIEGLRPWALALIPLAQKRAHTFELRLELANAGLGNAEDIEVTLTFPETVTVAERRPLPEPPKPPKCPEAEDISAAFRLDRKALELARHWGLDFLNRPVQLRGPVQIDSDASTPHAVRVTVSSIKNQSNVPLPTFEAWCSPGKVPGGFQVAYRVHAASTPKIAEGTLDVRVDVVTGKPSILRTFLHAPAEASNVTEEEVDAILADARDVPGDDET